MKKKYTLEELRLIYEDFRPQSELDFHEFGIINDYDIAQIYNEYIDESIKSGFIRLLIIVGKGKVVNPRVNRLLTKDSRVESFDQAGYFSGGKGAFEVTLKSVDK